MNKAYYELGQKIRNFRIRSGKSQMELELEIGASAGSLSRIENGEVNPTKETLYKIGQSLELNSMEIALLFNIDVQPSEENYKKAVILINNMAEELSEAKSLDEILDLIVKRLLSLIDLKVPGVYFLSNNGQYLETKKVNVPKSFLSIAEKGLNLKIENLKFDVKNKDNFLVKALTENRIVYSDALYDFAIPYLSRTVTDILQNIAKVKTVIAIPLIYRGKPMGVISAGSDKVVLNDYEMDIILACASQITIAMRHFA